jgi:hypothetical protein
VSTRNVHIHFGPGPLGLGLPVAVTSSLGNFEIHLVGEPTRPHPAYYVRTVVDRSGAQDTGEVAVASFTSPARQSVPKELQDAVADASLILITTSVRSAISERVPLIAALCEAADPSAEIVFLACENTVTRAHHALADVIAPRAKSLPTIVDRVCAWLRTSKEPNKLSQGEPPPFPRHVIHHEIGEWIIQRPTWDSGLPDALAGAPEVVFVDRAEFAAFEDRKLWVVNGMHLDVAIRGRAANQPDLRLVVNDPERLRLLQETVEVLAAALRRKHDMALESQWALDRLRVICQLPDATDRVLNDLQRADPSRFLRAFERRIAEPARVLQPVRALAPCLETLAGTLSELLGDAEQYSDWHSLTGAMLSERADEAAVSAYVAAMGGWMPDDYIAHGAKQFRASLRRHRGALER